MPKEAIYGEPGDRFVLEVGWNRDQDVQVGIRTVDHMHLVDEFYGQESVLERIGAGLHVQLAETHVPGVMSTDAELGRLVLDVVTGSDYGMESLWWHPSRQQINDLIRLLRKARTAAYGKDE